MAINYLSKDGAKWLMTKIKGLLNGKVDKVSGKGLSTNDYTTAEKNKLAGIATGANNYSLPAATASKLGGVKTGSNITNTDGEISLTKENVVGALGYTPPTTNTTYNDATQSVHGLMSIVDKKKLDAFGSASAYATKTYVGEQIAAAGHLSRVIADAKPEASAAEENVIYMIKKTSGSGDNLYDEFMLINGALERIGSTEVDLTPYAKSADFVALTDTELSTMWDSIS